MQCTIALFFARLCSLMQPCDVQVMAGVAALVPEWGSLQCDELSLMRRWQKGEERSLVCWRVCFCTGRKGLEEFNWSGFGMLEECLWIFLHLLIVFPCWCFCDCSLLTSTKDTKESFIVDYKSALDFFMENEGLELIRGESNKANKTVTCRHPRCRSEVTSIFGFLSTQFFLMEKYITAFGLHWDHSLCFNYRTRFMTERRDTLLLSSAFLWEAWMKLLSTLSLCTSSSNLTANDEDKGSEWRITKSTQLVGQTDRCKL